MWPRSLVNLRPVPFFSRAWGLVPKEFCPRKMEAAGANRWLPLQEAPTGSGGGLAVPF